jgi:hypothetical protein
VTPKGRFSSKGRRRMAEQIAALDPVIDAATLYRLTALYEFPFELRYGLNLAFYRTFAIPRIADVLAVSGQIASQPRKRAYDTGLFMYELIEAGGFDTEVARDVVRGLNRAHQGWGIANEDFRYVLAAFVVVPARWIDQFGWRRLTEHERRAMASFYAELGRRMGMTDLPDNYQAFEQILDDYEDLHLAPSPAGISHMRATTEIIAESLPRPLRTFAPLMTSAITDDVLCRSLGIPPARSSVKVVVRALLRLRGAIVRRMAPRETSWFAPGTRARSVYPNGYTISDLGPHGNRQSDGTASQ